MSSVITEPPEASRTGLGHRVGGILGRRRERLSAPTLAVLALPLLAVLFFYAFVVPQTPGRLARPSAELFDELTLWSKAAAAVPAPQSPNLTAVLLLVGAVVAFGTYAGAIALTWRRQPRRAALVAAGVASVAFFLVAALALPTVSTDIFDYISFGRVAAVHGANPYETPPSAFPDDPIYPYTSPRYTMDPDNKLPAWMALNVGLARVVGGDPVTALLSYRFALLALNAVNVLLVGLILMRLKPEYAVAGIVTYGWNPVVAVFGQSKTDTVMVLFFLLAALGLTAGRRYLGVLAFAVSACVKLLTFPLLVVYWVRELYRRRWREVAIGIVLFAAVVGILYAPFGGLDLLHEHLDVQVGGASRLVDSGALRTAASAIALVVAAAIALVSARDPSPAGLFRSWAVTAALVCLALVRPSFAWYLMTLVAASSLAAAWWAAAVTIALTGIYFTTTSWRSTSQADFKLPDLVSGTALIAIALACALVIAAGVLWRRRVSARQGV